MGAGARRTATAWLVAICCVGGGMAQLLDKALAGRTGLAAGYASRHEVEARMAARPLRPVEGIWQLTGSGATVAVEHDPLLSPGQGQVGVYRMVLMSAESLSLPPGTVLGVLTESAVGHQYDSRMYTSLSDDHRRLGSPERITVKVEADGTRMAFRPYGRKIRFNWWRLLLPYSYRGAVTPLERERRDADGALKLYPPPSVPLNPIYL